MQKYYSYLKDEDFLVEIDSLPVQERFVKITLLDYKTETEIDSIEGEIADGSLTKDGSSTVRCSCSLSCKVDGFTYDIYDIESKYSINKKIFIEIGVTNETDKYLDNPIIWFPQGVMIISDFTLSSNANGVITIQLKFKDKMCLLDGTVGGMLPATTRFDIVTETINGETVNNKVPVYRIIQEAVNHFGGEALTNILIEDIPDKAKRALKWNSATPLWLLVQGDQYFAKRQDDLTSLGGGAWNGQCYRAGHDVGFVYEDFVYDKELTFNAGSTIVQLLDTIKQWLGNFEYFYDEYGIFHFREIKNYLNTSVSTYEWTKNFKDQDYIYNPINTGIVYDFSDNININSMSINPQYQNIKNDYVIIGKNQTQTGSTDVIYHFVIDEKPKINENGYSNILLYVDPSTEKYSLACPQMMYAEEFNQLQNGELNQVYGVWDGYPNNKLNFKENVESIADFNKSFIDLIGDSNGNVGKIDKLLSPEFFNYDADKDTIDINAYIKSVINNPIANSTLSVVLTLLNYLIEQYACGKNVGSEELSAFVDNQITIEGLSTDIKECYYTIGYLMGKRSDPLFEESYNNYIKENYTSYKTFKLDIYELFNIFKGIGTTNTAIYPSFYDSCNSILFTLKLYISNINSYLLNGTRGMYKKESKRYNNLVQLVNLFKELKKLIEALLTRAYLNLNVSTLRTPSDFVYYEIEKEYSVGGLKFYSWDGIKKDWNELEWEYYYVDGGGYHYIDFTNSALKELMALPPDSNIDLKEGEYAENNSTAVSMNCNSYWYREKFVPVASNANIPYVQPRELDRYIAKDYRTEILLQGLLSESLGTKKSEYYAEIYANWPVMYNLKTQTYYNSSNLTDDFYSGDQVVLNNETDMSFSNYEGEKVLVNDGNTTGHEIYYSDNELIINTGYTDNTITGNYFFDMLDASTSKWGEYSVSNIGCRRLVVTNDDINCLFSQPIPDNGFVFIADKTKSEIDEEINLIRQNGCNNIYKIDSSIYNYLSTGGTSNGAYDILRYNLLTHIDYQETINITTRPIFHLSPNSLIHIYDTTTNTAGNYVSKSLTIPLKIGSDMNINITKVQEKI